MIKKLLSSYSKYIVWINYNKLFNIPSYTEKIENFKVSKRKRKLKPSA